MTFRPRTKELIITSKVRFPDFREDFKRYLEYQLSIPIFSRQTKLAVDRIKHEDGKIEDLVEIIDRDPGLVVEIIKLANSAAFGDKPPVTSTKQAVLRMGADNVLAAAISHGALTNLPESLSEELRGHSFWTGVFVKLLTVGTKLDHEMLYTASLLHDIGLTIMLSFLISKHSPLFANAGCIDEVASFGLTHAEVGYIFLTKIGFPDQIRNIVRSHHNHEEHSQDTNLLTIQLAEALAAKKLGSCPDNIETIVSIDVAATKLSPPSSIEKILQLSGVS